MNTPTSTPPPLPPARTHSRVGSVVLVVAGSVLAVLMIGLLAGGGLLMWADRTQRDGSGYLTSGIGPLSARSYAIATSNLDLNLSGRAWPVDQHALGNVRITASSASPSGVFIGIAPRADALRYLDGVEYDGLTDLQFLPYHVTYTPHAGGAPPLPTSESFWQAQATGMGTQTLTWTVAPGQWIV